MSKSKLTSTEPTKRLSGGAQIRASGRHPVLLGVSTEDRDILRDAAEIEKRPVSQFLIYHGVMAAKKILEKNREKTLAP